MRMTNAVRFASSIPRVLQARQRNDPRVSRLVVLGAQDVVCLGLVFTARRANKKRMKYVPRITRSVRCFRRLPTDGGVLERNLACNFRAAFRVKVAQLAFRQNVVPRLSNKC